jgi:hypothetical protein
MSETTNQFETWWQDHRAAVRDADTVRADLYVRSLGAPINSQECQTSTVDRLKELEADGPVTTTTVRIWGDRVYPDDCCAETAAGQYVLEKIEEFQSWAARTDGVQLPLHRERMTSLLDDDSRTMMRLPQNCLSVYLDGSLGAVVPCSIGDRDCSLLGYLDSLSTAPETTVHSTKMPTDTAPIQ